MSCGVLRGIILFLNIEAGSPISELPPSMDDDLVSVRNSLNESKKKSRMFHSVRSPQSE